MFALQAFRTSYVKALELLLAFLSSMSGDVAASPCPEASLYPYDAAAPYVRISNSVLRIGVSFAVSSRKACRRGKRVKQLRRQYQR